MLTLLSTLLPPALAGTPAYYHPDDVAAQSAVFRDSADALAPAFDSAQTALASLGRDLESLEIGTALLGQRAPESLRAWTKEAQETVTVQYLTVQRHVDMIQDGYGTVFGDALQRALAAQSAFTAVECASGGGLSAMMRRGGSGSCEGEDLNARLAAAIDADARLRAELSGLTGADWPAIGLDGRTQPGVPVSGTGRDVNVAALADALIGNLLDRLLESFEDALAPLEEGIDAGDESTLARAADLKAAYQARLGEDGAVFLAAVEAAIARAGKKADTSNIALCANPAGLGGCGGEDATQVVYDLIREDRKLQKAVEKLSGS